MTLERAIGYRSRDTHVRRDDGGISSDRRWPRRFACLVLFASMACRLDREYLAPPGDAPVLEGVQPDAGARWDVRRDVAMDVRTAPADRSPDVDPRDRPIVRDAGLDLLGRPDARDAARDVSFDRGSAADTAVDRPPH